MIASEYFVILWLIPVTIFIIIPLAICCCYLAIRCVNDLAAGRIPFYDVFSKQYYIPAEGVQKRKEPRSSVEKHVKAEISDGVHSFSGLVDNISSMGMCIKHIPETLTEVGEKMSVVIKTGEEELVLAGRLCWQYLNEPEGRMLGLEVTGAQENWHQYVLSR